MVTEPAGNARDEASQTASLRDDSAVCRCGHERGDHSPAREDDFACGRCDCNGFDPWMLAAPSDVADLDATREVESD